MEKKEPFIAKSDIFLLVAIMLIAGVAYFLYACFQKDGYMARVMVDGKEIAILSLSDDISYEVNTEKGNNRVVIQDGKVIVQEADCPDKICVKHKAIDKVGETIICLPHNLVVEVISD